MPWCPQCRSEYREGFTKCSDCGTDLVNELEAENEEEKELEAVQYDTEEFLISVNDEIEFNIIESKLKQAGIPVMRKYRESGGYLSIYMGATPFGIDIYVPSSVLDLAKNILEADETDDPANEQEFPEDIEEKPLNEQENRYDIRKRRRAWIILLLFTPGIIWLVIAIIHALLERIK